MNPRRHRKKFRSKRHLNLNLQSEMSLIDLGTGEKGIVKGITGGRRMKERVSSLGFVPETVVYILQNIRHGPLIVRVHDARIALGREVARRILIHRKET